MYGGISVKTLFPFLSGSLLTATVAYLAGGGMRAGILIGLSLAILPLLFWPRKAASLLSRYSRALDAFRTKPEAVKLAVVRSNVPRAATPGRHRTEDLSAVQLDVISALVNLGKTEKQARAAVAQIGDGDFETLFRKAVA